MKQFLRTITLLGIITAGSLMTNAQQVNTLYFLENAPMRHTINPAIQPVQSFYMAFPAIGYTSAWLGNYDMTLNNWVYKNEAGQVTTVLKSTAVSYTHLTLPTKA